MVRHRAKRCFSRVKREEAMTEMRSVLVIVILGLFLVGCGGAPSSSTLPGARLEGDKAAERNLHPDKVGSP